MSKKNPLLRAAAQIGAAFPDQTAQRHRTIEQRCEQLVQEMRSLELQLRHLRKARYRRWHTAARKVAATITLLAERVEWQAQHLRNQFQTRVQPRPSLRDIYAELEQLTDEFAEFRIDLDPLSLVATTESIELEGIELGRFAIHLEIEHTFDASPDRCLRVMALDPNTPLHHPHVTHPHVSDDRLCPGDAALPMTNALKEGRFADVLLLARSVLETYNDGSAYVNLDLWSGTPCRECAVVCDPEEVLHCRACEEPYCDTCAYTCQHCSTLVCGNCSSTCEACEDRYCEGCMSCCDECGHACCPSCLTDTLCETCTQEKENESDDPENDDHEQEEGQLHPEETRTGAGNGATAAVHTDGVGQAPLPLSQG